LRKVIDPTDSTSDTGEFLNLPSFLIDSGVLAQLGDPAGIFPVKIGIEIAPKGVLHDFTETIRMGVMRFNYCGSASENLSNPNVKIVCNDPDNPSEPDKDGGVITSYIGDPNSDPIEAINAIKATSWTPFAEAYYNAIAYFVKDASDNTDLCTKCFKASAQAISEPLNADDFLGQMNPIQYFCQGNHILILSDGASTTDLNTTMTDKINDVSNLFNDGDPNEPASCGKFSGSTYLDDLAHYAHEKNIFNPLDDNSDDDDLAQKITTHVIYTGPETSAVTDECAPKILMENTADNGGYPIIMPDSPEELAQKLRQRLYEVIGGSASGTAVSVLSTTGEGEGAIYQAHFYPEKKSRKWPGFIQALFVDAYGNLREDTNSNDTLDLDTLVDGDYILEMEYSKACSGNLSIACDIDDDCTVGEDSYGRCREMALFNKFEDDGGDGIKDDFNSKVNINDVKAIWRGGKELWEMDPVERSMWTTINGFTRINFDTVEAANLMPYLRAADNDGNAEALNIIKWIRGFDFTDSHTGADFKPYVTDAGHPSGYRERSIKPDGETETHVWKLGDIVYSTPSAVGKPMENYDLLYGDISYVLFGETHKKRRHIVYTGANDGMLHAFNGGYYNDKTHEYCTGVPVAGVCTSKDTDPSLGSELWAFIPRGLLPHLKWLTNPNYTHVYYVDLNPKITDVKIFDDYDSFHSNGWGTILIGGFRYGGKDISWESGGTPYSASPEYFALDITDQDNAEFRLLWTFSHPKLGLSMSYPSVARVCDNNVGYTCNNPKWYVIIGSGATDYDAQSNLTAFQDGNIFVLELSSGTNGVITNWTENSNFWIIPTGNAKAYLADPISVDADKSYNVDVVYIGETYKRPIKWSSIMHRITTNKGTQTDPAQWELSPTGIVEIASVAGPKDKIKKITSAPAAALDDKTNLWVYFGTGQFLGLADRNTDDTGAFYAIKDGCWRGDCTTSYLDLVDISKATVKTDGSVSDVSGCGNATTWNSLMSAVDSCDGWVMYFNDVGESVDFMGNSMNHIGERVFTKPLVIGGITAWGTYIPGTDPCDYLGESNAYAVYYKSGTAYKDYVFEKQKEDENPSDEVARTVSLGKGMPSSPSAQVTKEGTAKMFFQQSTGTIRTIENFTPISLRSNIIGWTCESIK
jgi:type IV pilus assembly protein PilY1